MGRGKDLTEKEKGKIDLLLKHERSISGIERKYQEVEAWYAITSPIPIPMVLKGTMSVRSRAPRE